MAVTLRNLSATGAMVEGEHGLAPGVEIVLRKDELAVPGRVVWVDGRRVGLEFSISVDPDCVLRDVATPKARNNVVHRRPGFRGKMSHGEREYGATLWDLPPPSKGG